MTEAAPSARHSSSRLDQLLRTRTVLLLVLLAAIVLLVSGSRVWLHGATQDAVLGPTLVRGTGSQVARGVIGAALVGAAAAVAAATAGRLVRIIAATATLLAGVLALVLVMRLVLGPDAALGELAATSSALRGTVPVKATVTVWPWIAAVAGAAMGLGGVAALVGGRRWSGLSDRYDSPVSGVSEPPGVQGRGQGVVSSVPSGPAGGAVRSRGASTWDQLSRGEDPTAAGEGADTVGRAPDDRAEGGRARDDSA